MPGLPNQMSRVAEVEIGLHFSGEHDSSCARESLREFVLKRDDVARWFGGLTRQEHNSVTPWNQSENVVGKLKNCNRNRDTRDCHRVDGLHCDLRVEASWGSVDAIPPVYLGSRD